MRLNGLVYHFFFNDTATTEIYTLSLHDALPISRRMMSRMVSMKLPVVHSPTRAPSQIRLPDRASSTRSEEHTSELQSRQYLVCRLLLEKKKKTPDERQTSN